MASIVNATVKMFVGTSILKKTVPNLLKTLSKPQRKMATLEQIIENNKRNVELMSSMSHELCAMQDHIVYLRKKQLRAENAALQQQVDVAKAQLIALELRNGKKQVALPNTRRGLCTEVKQQAPAPKAVAGGDAATVDAQKSKQQKQSKEVKPKKEKAAAPATTVTVEVVDVVGRLDMRVGKIVEVGRHPDADSLYLEKIDCGEAQPRTVVSGLVKYVSLEEMQNRMVVVLCNLKPAKMRGVTSEAMVMCASSPEKVEVLSPPANALPGDLVHCEGYTRQPDAQLNPKKKIFETCAPDLMTNAELIACYKGAALHVPGKGNIVAQTLKNVNVK